MIHDQGREALEELMREAELFATVSIKHHGAVDSALFIRGENGTAMFKPSDMSGISSKNEFVDDARIICIAEGAVATVFVSEAWTRKLSKGEKLDLSKSLSEYSDRQEIVMVFGESREEDVRKVMPIVRSAQPNFVGFEESSLVPGETAFGRFSNFLTADIPDDEERKIAQRILEAKGLRPKNAPEAGRGRGF